MIGGQLIYVSGHRSETGSEARQIKFCVQISSVRPTSHHSPHSVDMNKKVKKREKTAEQELKVQAAIESVRLEKYKNLTQAAKALGIP